MATSARLRGIIDRLHRDHGPPFLPPTTDPFGLVLWEQVAYLADDARRMEAFGRLQQDVGLTPETVLAAPRARLVAITKAGGKTAFAERADRMRTSAALVLDRWGGDLASVLARPYREARRALQRFPMIGPPGADKILLLTRAHRVLPLDSNALRVLLRLGFGTEQSAYSATYDSVQAAAWAQCVPEFDWLTLAYGLLRDHGQETCRRRGPHCTQCGIEAGCPSSEVRSA